MPRATWHKASSLQKGRVVLKSPEPWFSSSWPLSPADSTRQRGGGSLFPAHSHPCSLHQDVAESASELRLHLFKVICCAPPTMSSQPCIQVDLPEPASSSGDIYSYPALGLMLLVAVTVGLAAATVTAMTIISSSSSRVRLPGCEPQLRVWPSHSTQEM